MRDGNSRRPAKGRIKAAPRKYTIVHYLDPFVNMPFTRVVQFFRSAVATMCGTAAIVDDAGGLSKQAEN
jgi:hypothetical protein